MPQNKMPANIARLIRIQDTWFITGQRMGIEVQDSGASIHPYVLLAASMRQETVLRIEVLPGEPAIEQVQRFLWNCMSSPEKTSGLRPSRPVEITTDQGEWVKALAPDLEKIDVKIHPKARPDEIKNLLEEMENEISPQPELDGLLSIAGVTPKLAGDLFAAAADYYRAAPWKKWQEMYAVAATFPSLDRTVYVQSMGGGGMEFGLVLYQDMDEMLDMLDQADHLVAEIPKNGMHALSFEPASSLPEADLEAIKNYNWPLAGPRAHPWPVVFYADRAERPDRDELLIYIALLRAMPQFLDQALSADLEEDDLPIEADHTITTIDGPLELHLEYPAGETPAILSLDEDEEDLTDLLSEYQPPLRLQDASLQEANRLVEKVHSEIDSQKRVRTARQALQISPNCVEAYLILGDEADTPEESLEYFRQGAEVGESLLGEEFLAEYSGRLWHIPDARAYLLARQSIADVQFYLEQWEDALQHYMALLTLNPMDHQGVRFPALLVTVLAGQDEQAQHLLEVYSDGEHAVWPYAQALLRFRREGDRVTSRKALAQALKANRYIPDYLTGRKSIPEELPEEASFGDEDEAIHYAVDYYRAWWGTPGAVAWLQSHLVEKPARTGKKKRRR